MVWSPSRAWITRRCGLNFDTTPENVSSGVDKMRPAGGAGWVVQTTPLLGGTNGWTIVSSRITNDQNTAHVTVPLAAFTGSSDLFRLWNPSIQGP